MSTTRVPASPSPELDPSRTLGRLLARQREAFLREGPPSYAARKEDLRKLRTAVLAHRRDIAETLIADFGHRSRHETEILELMTLVWGIEYLEKNLRRFMRPERRHVALPMRMAKARVEYQPLGVVGIISPWNYPVSLALMPLATALASGNRAMLKPSEITPRTSRLLQKLLGEIFEDDQVAVVIGDAGVGAAFSALPFDKLVFTGSTGVGRAVARAASEHLVPVMLELGGKSPAIVDEGQPLARVATSIAFGKLANAGQTCIAPDYVMIHERDVEPFVAAYREAVAALYPAGPTSHDYSAIVNERHHDRLRGLLDDARAQGARVVEVGELPETARSRARTLPPALVLDASDRMRVMQEEIFGPILPILTYRTLDEAIAYVNAHPRPLALYYFGGKGPNREKLLTRTTSGNVTINGTLLHYAQDALPFGGVGASGMGAYHGIEGFRAFSHAKGVLEQGRWNGSVLLMPPFRRVANFVLRLMLGSPSPRSAVSISQARGT
jgi:coniferyl-aldehyde dehydrogenase